MEPGGDVDLLDMAVLFAADNVDHNIIMLMEGTGLKNILETVFGENAVMHMMTEKAVQRALRGHLLVDKCLHSQLVIEMAKDNYEIQTLLDQSRTLPP